MVDRLASTRKFGGALAIVGGVLALACPSTRGTAPNPTAPIEVSVVSDDTAPASSVFEPTPASGSIACGSKACVAGREVCCFLHAYDAAYRGECVESVALREKGDCLAWFGRPRIHQQDGVSATWNAVSLECDDASDCPSGESCCYEGSAGLSQWGEPFGAVCRAGACGAERFCSDSEPCPRRHVCEVLPEEAWASAQKPEPFVQHNERLELRACRLADARVVCGDAICQGNTPDCCWNMNQGRGECLKPHEDCRWHSVSCDDDADCPEGLRCCMGYSGIVGCSQRCDASGDPEALMGSPVCQRDADCPKVDGASQRCAPFGSSDPDEPQYYPPGIRGCTSDANP
jgi:hypothetical protein